MFEQDYVMRMINEISRVLAKLLFNADTQTVNIEDLTDLEDSNGQLLLDNLLAMVDEGLINEAENKIYELSERKMMSDLQIVLRFYTYLNEKSDSFLEEHNYSREEIISGLRDITSRYGVKGFVEMFME